MKRYEAEQGRRDQNHDAWFGVVHVKDKSLLHQRSAKHYFKGSMEDDIFVPTPMLDADEADSCTAASRHTLKRVLLIGFVVVLAAFVIGMLIMIAKTNPGLIDFKPSNSYKIF